MATTLNTLTVENQWLSKPLTTQIFDHIAEHGEIPDFITYYSPYAAIGLRTINELEVIPHERNKTLYKLKALLRKEVEMVALHMSHFAQINVFDLCETTGDSPLPFILQLIQEEQLNRYVPVTSNPDINEMAGNRLQLFVMNSNLPEFKRDSIVAEVELEEYGNKVVDILKNDEADENTGNLHLLLNSRLGNSITPLKFLTNIYKSMQPGDFLAIGQGLYKPGLEDDIVNDYNNILRRNDCFFGVKALQKILDPNSDPSKISVYWSDKDGYNGIKMKFDFDTEVSMGDFTFGPRQSLDVMRSARMTEQQIIDLLKEVGFEIMEMAYGETHETALFFVQKM